MSQEMHQLRHIVPLMNQLLILIILNLGLVDRDGVRVRAQQNQQIDYRYGDSVSSFHPRLAVIIGIFSMMFAATFLLLIYAKCCLRGVLVRDSTDPTTGAAVTRSRRFSGIDKTAIESLPFFRFSTLKGSRTGLECAVCLSKFEDIEILRLLPKCKHAFHIGCIDHWLERHSSCPLCRCQVITDDPSISIHSNSMRLLSSSPSERVQDSNSIEISIEREEEDERIITAGSSASSRFNGIGSSFRKLFKGSNDGSNTSKNKERAIDQEQDDQKMLHKFNHRIVVSDVVFQNRWSNVSSSDLMFLNTEMLCELSSNRFSAPEPFEGNVTNDKDKPGDGQNQIEEMDRKRMFETKLNTTDDSALSSGSLTRLGANPGIQLPGTNGSKIISDVEKRSLSEITTFSRFRDMNTRNMKDERRRQLWLPIARQTVRWFATRERRAQDPPHMNPNTKETTDSMV